MEKNITLATSFAPGKENTVQKAACQSWLDAGIHVIGFNNPEEIELLAPIYPEVQFIPATRNAKERFGRPFVYIHDLLQCLKEAASPVVGFINSDIILRSFDGGIADFIQANIKNSLIYCNRYDILNSSDQTGRLLYGIDVFFFDPAILDLVEDYGFCLGKPGFDWALPFLYAHAGAQVKRLVNPVAFHLIHKQAWAPQESGLMVAPVVSRFGPMIKWGKRALYEPTHIYARSPETGGASVLAVVNTDRISRSADTVASLQADERIHLLFLGGDADLSEVMQTAREDYILLVGEDYLYLPEFLDVLRDALRASGRTAACASLEVRRHWTLTDILLSAQLMTELAADLRLGCMLFDRKKLSAAGHLPSPDEPDCAYISVPAVVCDFIRYIGRIILASNAQRYYFYGMNWHARRTVESGAFPGLLGIIDRDPEKQGQFVDDIEVFGPEVLRRTGDYDKVFILTGRYEQEVYEELLEFIPQEKLVKLYYNAKGDERV